MFASLALWSLLLGAPSLSLMFVGDSLTAGFGVRESEAYPALVGDLLREKKIDTKIINGGVSGDTTAGGLRRLPWMLRVNPDLVVIALGGNDMLRGIPPTATEQNLRSMIQLCQGRSIPVVLFGIHAPPNLGLSYERAFNAIFPKLAREFRVPLLDNYIAEVAGRSEFNIQDEMHPNIEGQKKVASSIVQFFFSHRELKKYFESWTQKAP